MGEEAVIQPNKEGVMCVIQGDISFPIEDDIVKTLESFQRQNAGLWSRFAVLNGISVEPFNQKLLTPVLLGVVQNIWYRWKTGVVPEKCLLNQELRLKDYEKNLQNVRDGVIPAPGRAVRPTSSTPRLVRTYMLSEATKKMWEPFKGQKGVIVKHMTALNAIGPNGTPVTAQQIADACRPEITGVQSSEKVVNFYIGVWIKEGVLYNPVEAPIG